MLCSAVHRSGPPDSDHEDKILTWDVDLSQKFHQASQCPFCLPIFFSMHKHELRMLTIVFDRTSLVISYVSKTSPPCALLHRPAACIAVTAGATLAPGGEPSTSRGDLFGRWHLSASCIKTLVGHMHATRQLHYRRVLVLATSCTTHLIFLHHTYNLTSHCVSNGHALEQSNFPSSNCHELTTHATPQRKISGPRSLGRFPSMQAITTPGT